MVKFINDRPVETTSPVVEVENELKRGDHKFSLVVEDDEGNRSEPNIVVVTIRNRD